jgi:hypothetical protein
VNACGCRERAQGVTGLPFDIPPGHDSLASRVPEEIGLDEAVRRALEAQRPGGGTSAETTDGRARGRARQLVSSLSLFLNSNRRSSSEELWPEDRDFTQAATMSLAARDSDLDGRRTGADAPGAGDVAAGRAPSRTRAETWSSRCSIPAVPAGGR